MYESDESGPCFNRDTALRQPSREPETTRTASGMQMLLTSRRLAIELSTYDCTRKSCSQCLLIHRRGALTIIARDNRILHRTKFLSLVSHPAPLRNAPRCTSNRSQILGAIQARSSRARFDPEYRQRSTACNECGSSRSNGQKVGTSLWRRRAECHLPPRTSRWWAQFWARPGKQAMRESKRDRESY